MYLSLSAYGRVRSIASRLSYLAYTPKNRTENCLRRTLLFPPPSLISNLRLPIEGGCAKGWWGVRIGPRDGRGRVNGGREWCTVVVVVVPKSGASETPRSARSRRKGERASGATVGR